MLEILKTINTYSNKDFKTHSKSSRSLHCPSLVRQREEGKNLLYFRLLLSYNDQ